MDIGSILLSGPVKKQILAGFSKVDISPEIPETWAWCKMTDAR